MIILKSVEDLNAVRNMNRILGRPAVRNLVISPEGRNLNGNQASQLSPRKKRIVGLFNEGGLSLAAPTVSLLFLAQILVELSKSGGLSVLAVLWAFCVAFGSGIIVKALVLVWNHYRLEKELKALYPVFNSTHAF